VGGKAFSLANSAAMSPSVRPSRDTWMTLERF
jgi:hypothetical protein